MTEYGRGSGSQPWNPGDPHYGDQGYEGGQYPPQQAQQQPYYGQQQYAEQQQYGWDTAQGGGGHAGGSDGQGGYYGAGYPQAYDTGQHPHLQGQQPYDTGQHPHVQGGQQYDTGQHPHPQGQSSYGTGQQPHVPYDTGQQRFPQQPAPVQEPPEDWSDGSSTGTQPFLAKEEAPAPAVSSPAIDLLPGGGADEGDDEPRRGRRGGKAKKAPKRRSGTACLVVAVVLLGAVGGGGYLAYDYWQTNYGPAPDYEGEGSGQVQVEVAKGSGLTQIGDALQRKGVVKSSRAFTEAANGKLIQPGTYTLNKEMSAASAVTMMTDAKNLLTLREGIRASAVYTAIDQKLELKPGTTKEVAHNQVKNLGLPAWATASSEVKDPLEGFLFPSQYNAGKGTKPEEILRQMVARAVKNYGEQDLEGKAKELGLKSPLEVITVASLVQVEGKYKHDFDKIARVIYNRLKPDNKETNGKLDFDSTVNYAKSQSTLDIGSVNDLRQFKHPYNTYYIQGLPPGPISNPGMDALKSALEPASGPWYYFVSINENETLFAVSNAEHNKNRDRYNQERKKAGQ
ncbi:endolytic transglycosylase MltG [Streptomyces sp. AV19]|uniref:endolytic transglycosylase MltG n=1 Tax=Streptomyces sp. AV19 TaxID=2793068 RepID=UPI0018FF0D1F|nr:endolytic transglycosylase MltG [Streptomyces sp. AV19]MBH1936853.1 endolytic transglycosylase MltG [Streptomyces sp. AV19]MDG4532894.1 endolytic transglycosylase MltG [Streptomyces sp. AV19]